jgi:SAM-dependent methyltransferase
MSFDDPRIRDPYLEHCETIRGRVRTAIVHRHLEAALAPVTTSRLRVLDVGCGDGRDAAWLAALGHEVLGLDCSRQMIGGAEDRYAATSFDGSLTFAHGTQKQALIDFGPGAFDLVLSHGVIMYQHDPRPFVAEHLALVGDGGTLSLLAKNVDALVHRAARERSVDEALRLLDGASGVGHLGVTTSAQSIQQLADFGAQSAATVRSWAGVRVFTDTRADPIAEAEDDQVIELEWRAARRDPHRQVAALLHVLYDKTPSASASSQDTQSRPGR